MASVCCSPEVWQVRDDSARRFVAVIGIREFAALHAERAHGAKVRTTKAMDDALLRDLAPKTRAVADASPPRR